MATNITLDDIIDVSVTISPSISYRKTFNAGLILGDSTTTSDITDEEGNTTTTTGAVISADTRTIECSSLDDVAAAGFATTSPEYLAAQNYFRQSPKPAELYIGCKQSTESVLEAITACRANCLEWYCAIICDNITDTMSVDDCKAVASYIESAKPESMLALSLNSTNTEWEDICSALQQGAYQKTIVQYDESSENAGHTPIAGIIGYAMGYNKELNAAFTLAYKSVTGLHANNLTTAQLKTILGYNANVYVNQGYYYNLFRQGTMCNGDHFDEVYYIDILVNDLRNELIDLLINNPKIPQTEKGISQLTNTIASVLDTYVDVQFIQPGIWLGEDILELENGDTLDAGYLIQFDDLDSQSATDRAARKAPVCYIAIKLGGAIEYITLGISISR